jgi:predicted Zn-dependent protease
MSNVSNYFASTINPHVDVARFDNSMHIASASTYSDCVNYENYNSKFYIQKPLSNNNIHALSFNDISNIQHYTHTPAVQQVQKSVNMYQGQTNMVSLANSYGTPHASNSTNFHKGVSSIYSSARYGITSQNMTVNEKIGYANSSHQASYSQTSCATDLYNIQQGRDESVYNYLERFKEIKNRCFNLPFSDSDLAYLAFKGLKSSLRDWLRDIKFNSLDEVLVKAMAYQLSIKEQNEKIGHANSSYQASCSQSSYATQHDTRVEVHSSTSLANSNNYDWLQMFLITLAKLMKIQQGRGHL